MYQGGERVSLVADRYASGVGKIAVLAGGIVVGVTTGNPFPAIAAAVDFVAWVNGVWQESNQKPASSQRPTQTVSEIIDSAMECREPPTFSSLTCSASWAESGQPAWTARSTESDRAAVQTRARMIARSSKRGNDVDHWLQATIELHIAKRAEEISRIRPGRGELDNWLQAERELLIAQRAREIANSPAAAGELDNWLRAEREVLTRLRAGEIAKSPQSGGDMDNWLQAEREVLIAQHARELAASPNAGGELDNWLHAERKVLTELLATTIAKSPQSGGDMDNWLQAEREVLIAQHAREFAASPNAGGELDNWLQAETDLVARGVIKHRPRQAGFGVAQQLTVRAILRVRTDTA
jgi:hypothetical protein